MSTENRNLRIGISCGDLNGIGHEVVIKCAMDPRLSELCTIIFYSSQKVVAAHRKALDIKDFSFNLITDVTKPHDKRPNLFECWTEDVELSIGKQNPALGKYALKSLQTAVSDLKAGHIDALVTAPIDKSCIQSDEFEFPGHTEYLAAEFEAQEHSMFMLSEPVKMTFMTGHVPLSKVSEQLSFESIIKRIRFIDRELARDFTLPRPKIAVLGLNPHNGDDGVIGTEEQELIAPAIRKAKDDGLLVFGPFSADGFFGSGAFKQYDMVLAMYHDQGLIPFKTMNFERGVNFTSGLSHVRTSPDHGTAYDIAGKGIADPQSMRDAIYSACDIYRNRSEYNALKENELVPENDRSRGGWSDKKD
jgi:4-hydroxythreonine-4-phosphate dehydrogenase